MQVVALRAEPLGQALRERHGVAAGVHVAQPAVLLLEQHVELQPQETPLRQQRPALLHEREEVVVELRLGEHHGLAAQCAHLRAADIERVAQTRDVGQRDVGTHGGKAVAQARAVHEQPHAEVAAHLRKRLELGQRVDGAVLGGMRDIHGPGRHDVLAVLVGPVRLAERPHLGGVQLPVVLRQRQRLASTRLHRARLMGGDMPGCGGDDALPRSQDLVGHRGVRLRAAHEEVHGSLGARARLADAAAGALAHLVGAVAARLVEVCCSQPLDDGRMRTLHIVRIEMKHRLPLPVLRCVLLHIV